MEAQTLQYKNTYPQTLVVTITNKLLKILNCPSFIELDGHIIVICFIIFVFVPFQPNNLTRELVYSFAWLVWILFPICPGPDWTVCSTYIRREICLGYWCSYTNSIHGYPGKLYSPASFVQVSDPQTIVLFSPGHRSINIYSSTQWECQWEASDFCRASCMDNPRGKLYSPGLRKRISSSWIYYQYFFLDNAIISAIHC